MAGARPLKRKTRTPTWLWASGLSSMSPVNRSNGSIHYKNQDRKGRMEGTLLSPPSLSPGFCLQQQQNIAVDICLTKAATHTQMCLQGTESESKLSLYRHRVWITIKIAPRSPSAQRKAVCKCLHTGRFPSGVHNRRWASWTQTNSLVFLSPDCKGWCKRVLLTSHLINHSSSVKTIRKPTAGVTDI